MQDTSTLSWLTTGSVAIVIVWVSLLFATGVYAQDQSSASFEVTPKRCVTLRQGQPCFVRLTFEWQSTELVEACLVDQDAVELKCWLTAKEGIVVLSQSLPSTTEFILLDKDGVELNKASVVVSWVYRKKRSKRRWRLF